MTPSAIIRQVTEDGVSLALSPAGTIKAIGSKAAVNRWLPLIRANKPSIVATLKEVANAVFSFNPPNDPANDDEALQERVAIMMEGNGWGEATALREWRLNAGRERCWRGSLLNTKRVQETQENLRKALLPQHQVDAMELHQQKALTMLHRDTSLCYAAVANNLDTDPVTVTLGIREANGSIVTCDLLIPKAKYDPHLLSALLKQYGGTIQ